MDADETRASAVSAARLAEVLRNFVTTMRSSNERFLNSEDMAVRAEFSRRLRGGAGVLHAIAREMESRSNTVAPISRLPKEVFIMIVKAVSDEEPLRSPWFTYRSSHSNTLMSQTVSERGSLGWIRLSHVCTSWRLQILNARSLWARNLGIFPKALLEFLSRAGPTAPLDFDADLHPALHVPSCEVMFTHLPLARLRSMEWSLYNKRDINFIHRSILAASDTDLSHLEKFDVTSTVAPDSYTLDKVHHLPKHFPAMRSLNADHFFIPFVAPNLTKFLLHNVSITLSSLFNVLSNSPGLLRLKLSTCRFQSDPVINRPYLAHLELFVLDFCHMSDGDCIYDRVDAQMLFPPSTRISACTDPCPDSTDAEVMRPHHLQWLSAIRLCTRSLRDSQSVVNVLTFSDTDFSLASCGNPVNGDDPVWQDTRLRGSRQQANFEHGFEESCVRCLQGSFRHTITTTTLGFGSITVLTIGMSFLQDWEDIFRLLPNVETMRCLVQSDNAGRLALEALCSHRDEHSSSDEGQSRMPYLPILSHLWVEEDMSRAPTTSNGAGGFELREVLLHMLQTRSELCIRGGTMTLRALYLQGFKDLPNDDHYLQALRAIVSEVKVVHCDKSKHVESQLLNDEMDFY